MLEKVEVKPVTRKLEENHVDFETIEEVGSPLIKNKIKHKNSLRGSSGSQNASPYILDSPDKQAVKTGYGLGIMRPKKV